MPSGINSFPYMRIRMWLIYTHIGLFHLWCYSHWNGNVVIWPIFCDWHRQLSNWQFAVQSVIKVSSKWHSSFQWPSTSSSVKKKMKELTKLALVENTANHGCQQSVLFLNCTYDRWRVAKLWSHKSMRIPSNGRHGVSNHQQLTCLYYRYFVHADIKKTSRFHITVPVWVTHGFPHKGQWYGKRFHVVTSSCNIRHVCKHKLSDKSPGHRLVTVTLAAHKAHVTPPVEKIRNQWALCITWKTTLWDIKSRTLTYCRRYLQMHFLDENQEFDSNEIYSRQSNFSWLQVNTCLDNGVVPNRRQAIIAPMMTHFIIACMRHRASKCWHIDKRIENLPFYERIFTKYFLEWTPRHVSAYLTLLPPLFTFHIDTNNVAFYHVATHFHYLIVERLSCQQNADLWFI